MLVFGVYAQAQQQDPGLLLQTRNQDLAKTFFQNKSFYDGKVFQADKKANINDFYLSEHFETKTFASKGFHSKSYSQRDLLFATKDAPTKTDARDQKLYETKAAAVKDAPESGKSFTTREYETREFIERGKSQKALDEQHTTKPMSIDDVRTLLNKNK